MSEEWGTTPPNEAIELEEQNAENNPVVAPEPDLNDAPPSLGEISRLIYLAARFKPTIPRAFAKFIPHADLLTEVSKFGITGTQVNVGAEMPSLENHYKAGAEFAPDEGNDAEFRVRIARIVDNYLSYEGRGDFSLVQRTAMYRLLDDYVIGNNTELVGRAESSLFGDVADVDGIVKWKTGLGFLDEAYGDEGAYQGLHVLMANPGTGKTSTLMLLMAALRRTKVASSLWYFSLETPLNMVRWRMTPLRQNTEFIEDDRIIAGMTPVSELLNRVYENPDPNRIILYDGPDVMSGGGDGRRFVLEDIFRELVMVKQACKAVFVPSQPRRGENQGMSLQSVAEAWSKAWYSDTVFGIEQLPHNTDGGDHRLKITNFKNRFGPTGKVVYYNINYRTFEYIINDGPSVPHFNLTGDAPEQERQGW